MNSSKSIMRQVEEKYAINEIDLIVWSNKIDLLALSNLKGEVSLHRLNWQRVWTLPPPTEDLRVSALCWRPDGRVLVISYHREVHVVDIEKKITVQKIVIDDDVCFVQWTQESDDNPSRYEGYLNWMSDAESSFKTYSSIQTRDSIDSPIENFRNIKLYPRLNFLLIALKKGEIQIHVFGLFCCGKINAAHILSKSQRSSQIVCTDISQNLKSLVITVRANEGDGESSLRCIIVDTGELAKKAQDLYNISCIRGSMLNTVNNINRSVVNTTEAHEHIIIQEMKMQIFNYSKDKPVETLSAELLELFIFGFYSPELSKFLLEELSDKKMRKIDSSIEICHSNILKQIVHHLRPSIEKLLCELTVILGLSRLSKIFPDEKLRIDEHYINRCLVTAGAFNLKANKILHILEDSSIKYKSFIKWLSSVASVVNNEREANLDFDQREMNLICEYLYEINGSTPISEKDELGQYLSDKDIITINSDGSEFENLWRKFLRENPSLEMYELIVPCSFDTKSLLQIHKCLVDQIESIFDNFVNYIKCDKTNATELFLASMTDDFKKCSIIEVSKNNSWLVAFIRCRQPANYVEIVRVSKTSEWSPKLATLYFENAEHEKYRVVDCQFYTDDIISVLLDREDCLHSFCIQLLIDSVHPFFSSGTAGNVFSVVDRECLKMIENMKCIKFAVSGKRKVSVVVAEDSHRVRIFEMEAEEEDETTLSSVNASHEETQHSTVGNTKLHDSDMSEVDFGNSIHEADTSSVMMIDESDDSKLNADTSVVEFGDIGGDVLTSMSSFLDVHEDDDLTVHSIDPELERNIASLAIHSDSVKLRTNGSCLLDISS